MAKILLVSWTGVGHWFTLRLEQEGHDVDIYYCGKHNNNILALDGLCPQPFTAKPNFSKYDLVMFEMTGRPQLAQEASSVTATIGDNEFATEMEDDRLTGITLMENAGITVPFYEGFNDISEAKSFVKKTNKRYVFKPSGHEQETAVTYVSKDRNDMLGYLDKLGDLSKGLEFILQEYVDGTEISTEGWFNGEDFFLVNSTLEEKKFMEGGIGPNTGCAGNLVFAHDNLNLPTVFTEGLGRLQGPLQDIGYRGMIDLNTIATPTKLYGLEWTPRFGYDASATLFHMLDSPLGDFLGEVASGEKPNYKLKHNFASGVRITIPPYPSEIEGHHPAEVPLLGLEEEEEIWRTHMLYDIMLDGDDYVTAGICGFIIVPLAGGSSIVQSFDKVYERVKRIHIPNMQYRRDIVTKTYERYKVLESQGWLR